MPNDFTLDELRYLLIHNGFIEIQRGKTSGSAIRFYRKSDGKTINMHRPHPENNIPRYIMKIAKDILEDND